MNELRQYRPPEGGRTDRKKRFGPDNKMITGALLLASLLGYESGESRGKVNQQREVAEYSQKLVRENLEIADNKNLQAQVSISSAQKFLVELAGKKVTLDDKKHFLALRDEALRKMSEAKIFMDLLKPVVALPELGAKADSIKKSEFIIREARYNNLQQTFYDTLNLEKIGHIL